LNKTQWIKNRIDKVGFKESYSEAEFTKYCKATGSNCSYKSYRRNVYYVKDKMETNSEDYQDEESVISAPVDYNESDLLDIIETEVAEKGTRLSRVDLQELAIKNSFHKDIWFSIKDFQKKLDFIYRSNLLDIKTKVDSHNVQSELKILKAENKHLIEQQATEDRFALILDKAVACYEPYPIKASSNASKVSDLEAVLFLSDIHMGEAVESHDTMGINVYNSFVAKERIDQYFEKVFSELVFLNIYKATVVFGGDLIGGIIHEEILRSADTAITTSILELSDYLAQKIQQLTQYVDSIRVFSTVGNHGRMIQGKPYYSDYVGYNFETLLLNFIKKETKDCVECFVIPEGTYTLFEIQGKMICLTHGHNFSGGGSGFSPIPNTIPRDTAKIIGAMRKEYGNIDYFMIGHFHNPFISNSFIDNVPVICNGSMKGADAYSLNKMKMATKPSQAFLIFEEGTGLKYYSNIELE